MFGGPTPPAESIRIMHDAIDRGINFFDTANIYSAGESELVVGKALADRREKVVLATKGRGPMGPGPNESGAGRLHLRRALEASLCRLQTDHVDLYYIHTPDYGTPIEETLRALDDFVREGKVLYTACSNFRAWRLMEALGVSQRLNLHRFQAVQPLYNLCNRISKWNCCRCARNTASEWSATAHWPAGFCRASTGWEQRFPREAGRPGETNGCSRPSCATPVSNWPRRCRRTAGRRDGC